MNKMIKRSIILGLLAMLLIVNNVYAQEPTEIDPSKWMNELDGIEILESNLECVISAILLCIILKFAEAQPYSGSDVNHPGLYIKDGDPIPADVYPINGRWGITVQQ